jgi:hypothetical protein
VPLFALQEVIDFATGIRNYQGPGYRQ